MKTKLPDNYRIVEHEWGGTGHGDERYGLALQVYESREVKRFWRRNYFHTTWWTVSTTDRATNEDRKQLLQTAGLRDKVSCG